MRMADLAIILATLIGPIAAVGITLWYQRNEQKYARKIAVFRSLMQWRANWLNPDWVGALNMIPVEYAGHREIVSAFNGLIDKLNDRGFSEGGDQLSRAHQQAETAFSELIQHLAKELRIDLTGLDLRGRVYAPKGWQNEQDSIYTLRSQSLAVLAGETPLKVEILSAASASEQAA